MQSAMNVNFVVWLILGLIWGSTWLVMKVGLDEALPPFTFAWIRFLIAFSLLFVIVWARKVPFVTTFRNYWWLLFATAFLQISWNFGIAFWAVQHIESGLSATLYTTLPLFSLVYAHFMLNTEKITAPRLFGVLIGIGGVALIFSKQLQLPDSMAFWGSAAIIAASLGMGLSQTLFKKYGRDVDAMLGVTFQIGVGLLPLLAIALIFEGSPMNVTWTAKGVLSILYLAVVGSAVAFALLYWLIQRIDVTKAALTPLVSTLTAVILGILVLGESFTWREVAGGVLIVSGLLLTTLRKRPIQDVDARPLTSPAPGSD